MARRIVTGLMGSLLLCGASASHADASRPTTLNPRLTTPRGLTAEQQKQLEYERYQKQVADERARAQATRPGAPGGLTVDGNADAASQEPATATPASNAPAEPGATSAARRTSGTRQTGGTAPQSPQYARVYVEDAQITGVSPTPLRGERVAVDVSVVLGKPIDPAELADQLQVLLDATPLAPFPLPVPTQPEPAAQVAPESGNAPAQSPAGIVRPVAVARADPGGSNKFALTLFARLPAELPSGVKMDLSVYDRLDGKTIARIAVEAAAPAAATADTVLKPENESFWDRYRWPVVIAVFVALAMFGFYTQRKEKREAAQKIRNLQETVQSTRAALGEVTGEAPRQNAVDSPPVRRVEIPGVIHEALERGELGVIVGAGASVHANLPVGASLWLGALEKLRGAVTDDQRLQLQKLIAESGSDAAIEPLLSLVGRERLLQALASLLAMEHASPREFHLHLCALGPLGVRRFVDLSWDRVLAEMLKPQQARTFSSRNFTGLSEALRSPQITLIKPYGEVGAAESMSLTPQEFRRQLSQAPELERCLASLFSAQNLLFVGMSTKAIEQFLSSLPAQLESSGREHFALVPFEWSLELWSQGFAKRYGITVLPVGPDGSEESVAQVLARIASEAQRRRAAQAPASGKQTTFTGIGTLRSVSLRNIGNFKSIDVDFEDHWNLLLGDNGGGKSTILRAITLALSGNDARGEAMAARLLRTGESSGSIELSLGPTGATKVRTTLVRDGTRVKISSPQVTPLQAGQGLVLGFPALRGVNTTQPTGPTRMDAPDPCVDDVAPLLQEKVDTRLNQLKQWVINTALQAETSPQGREAQMLKTFRRVLRDVVPGRHVEFKGVDRQTWSVWLSTDDGEASFDSLSQGTSSILGWVGVLLQRLYGIYPNAEHPEDGPALLLIDEIDAHLHPRWQRKLVTLTREQFPNVQMIASSHSPLLAGAMRRDELRIVERDPESGEMRAAMPLQDLRGQTADEILTSSLFALPTTRSPEAEALINKYFKLFEKHDRTHAEDGDLRRLETELDQLNYGPSRLMRETQQAIEQKFEAQLDGISPEIAAAMSARIASTKTQETA